MTVPLSPESPRRAAARQFGVLLKKTMARRQVGTHPLAVATGCATSAIACWRAGSNLPRLDTALRLAESLQEPRLGEIVRECRTGRCRGCGRVYLNEGGAPKIYCSDECRDRTYDNGKPVAAMEARAAALDLLRAELLRVGPIRKQAIGKALTLLTDEEERHPGLVARRRLPVFQAAIEAMCRACEPEGYCRDGSCPLRPVSPFLLAIEPKAVEIAVKPEGAWGPSRRKARLALQREVNARAWSRPGGREAQSERMVARHAAMTPEQRAENVRKLVGGQGRFKNRQKRHAVETTA
jgi:hypothetical protein